MLPGRSIVYSECALVIGKSTREVVQGRVRKQRLKTPKADMEKRAPIEESRKWAIYYIANLLFKTYFKVRFA